MKEINLRVQIEKNGVLIDAGKISGSNSDDATFSYNDEYASDSENAAISLSLPKEQKAFSPLQTRNFFEGLLPEGFTRRCVAQSIHADSEDYISILRKLGNECLGAIRVSDYDSQEISASYRKLSKKEIFALANEGAQKSADIVVKSHLSLTGASGKVGLYYSEKKRKWFQPLGNAPSTHIVKQSHVRLGNIVANEQLCLLTAKKLGISVPESFIVNASSFFSSDENVLFATKRYDRIIKDDCRECDGLKVPFRLHQEDFAQALGINSRDKYEKTGGEYLKKMFATIRGNFSNPIEDSLKLWKITIFIFLVGNTDNHIKNLSILYSEDLKSLSLAPAYDIVSTKIYDSSTDEMSLGINGKLTRASISRSDFESEAAHCGLGTKNAMKIFDQMKKDFPSALKESKRELEQFGFPQVRIVYDKITSLF